MLWFSEEVRPGLWVGFTAAAAGNLAFHVGADPLRVAGSRAALDARLTELTGSRSALHLQYMNQVHGREVAVVAEPAAAAGAGCPPRGPTADAMVSRSASLAVMVADCVPVVFAGTGVDGRPVLGVAHAGRPGIEKGVIAATVAELRSAGASALQAWLGPSVCGRCYEVPEGMRAAVSAVEPAAHSTTSWGTPALDLPAAAAAQLAALGVPARQVGACTLEVGALFSHRRAVRDGGAEGRLIGFAAVRP
ncbi:laccase domain-containing protein [Arthrobacter wenxiniae]|uniref:Laccase domain-containing protein n=1 Tax=Arthrobacter wenxiniae TaxID=2713570 RepID=A0A7Y7LYY3_9MICC|nr:laccase domain-containing protein [Arthrobacter wenxiniae]